MENENYIVVQGWMVNELHLKGNELFVFALIYGFSQDGQSVFRGSSSYVAEWLNITKRSALDILKNLTDKGYLIKQEQEIANNLKLCSYKISEAVKKFHRGGENFSLGGGEKTSPNNTNIDNNIDNNKEKKEISKEKKEFEDFWAMYPKQRAGSKQKALVAYLKVLKEKRATAEHLMAKVKEYASSREVREGFAKGCAAWLNDDRFNSDYNGGGNNGIGKDYNRENTGEYSGLGRKIG